MALIFRWFYAEMLRDKKKELQILLESDADWTLVRLPFIVEEPAKGIIKVNLHDMPGTKMTNADIADFLISQISDNQYMRKYPNISN